MQFIPFPESGVICSCDDVMFISYTPDGGDYVTCPVCGRGDYDVDYSCNNSNDDNMYNYCSKCKILYELSECVHAVNGCTDDCYYSKLVRKFKFNGIEYDGCPTFDSYDKYIENAHLYELELICSCQSVCGDFNCTKAYYKQKEYYRYDCKNHCHNNLASEYTNINSKIFMFLCKSKHKRMYCNVLRELKMKLNTEYIQKCIESNMRTNRILRIMSGMSLYQY